MLMPVIPDAEPWLRSRGETVRDLVRVSPAGPGWPPPGRRSRGWRV